MIKVAILTISTRGSKGERPEDGGAMAIREMLPKIQGEEVDYVVIRDDKEQIIWQLKRMAEIVKADVILTTGGTGLSPNDFTPEATLAVIDRRLPGFEHAMQAKGLENTPFAILSRAVAGTFERSMIINLPGNPNGVRDSLASVLQAIPHGVRVLRGNQIQDEEHQFSKRTGGSE